MGRIQNILYSRKEITIEYFRVREIMPGQAGIIEGRLRFWDSSLLEFTETLTEQGVVLIKTDYAYHYQDAMDTLIFRYDNAPHHAEIATHPHHKHASTGVEAANPPHLNDVLHEIDQYLYLKSSSGAPD
ncbi:MAG: hypothetical protein HYR94_10415 [Chloroflexi bacterium]|nr:hypothetical protein [Chloroflexota bacterium]